MDLESLTMDEINTEKPQTLTRKEVLEMLSETKDLRNLDIRKANLVKIDFSGCDLRGTNFSYSNLKDALFRGPSASRPWSRFPRSV